MSLSICNFLCKGETWRAISYISIYNIYKQSNIKYVSKTFRLLCVSLKKNSLSMSIVWLGYYDAIKINFRSMNKIKRFK